MSTPYYGIHFFHSGSHLLLLACICGAMSYAGWAAYSCTHPTNQTSTAQQVVQYCFLPAAAASSIVIKCLSVSDSRVEGDSVIYTLIPTGFFLSLFSEKSLFNLNVLVTILQTDMSSPLHPPERKLC